MEMATEISKTLEGVGAFGIQEDSRRETLISDSVATVAQTEDNDVGEDLADEKEVLTVVETRTDEIAVDGGGDGVINEKNCQAAGLSDNDLDVVSEEIVDMEMGESGNCDEKLDIDLNEEEEEEEEEEEGDDDDDDDEEEVDEEEEDDEQENKDDVESDGEEKEDYKIGDLVWGKIRSHPWWPGQIFDSSDASDYAKKQKSSGHLVAYFGDGSFSWCSRSQLRHMKEDDFDKKSRQSNSINFSTAVENALDEISRLVKLKMACPCVPVEADRRYVENAGIKQGVLVPDQGSITLLSTFGFESTELLASIKSFAKISSAKNRLEVATITGWLSAFNRKTKGSHELAVYNDTCYIDGLEDKKKKKDDKKVILSRLSIPEIMSDEEAMSLKKKGGAGSSMDPLHQRKKKSVADLLKESKTVETDSYQTPTPTAKKLKAAAKVIKTGNESSRKRTKKKTNEIEYNIDTKGGKGDEEIVEIVHTPRERKRSKYLSPPYTNPNTFFSKRDFKSDSIDAAKLSSMIEPVANSSESVVRTDSPATSDSYSMMEANESSKKVLSVLKFAALDPLDLTKKNPLGISKGILRSFREAYYLNGSTYKEYHPNQVGGKKRNLDNSGGRKHGKKKIKQSMEEVEEKEEEEEEEEEEEKVAPTLLMATFPPGFSLPSKDKIIGMFSKFGILNEMMTDVSYNSYCARIAFVNSSDAEDAFKSCSSKKEEEEEEGKEKNPFGDDCGGGKIKYRLGFASGVECEKPNVVVVENEDKGRLDFIKKKLEKMTSMLEKCEGSVSGERKKKLEDEMKSLVEKVSEMMEEC